MSTPKFIDILLVEDNPGDVLLTQEAMRESKVLNTLHVVNDGVEAWDYLNKVPPYEDALIPDLILLDLNMPRMDGRELLERIKSDKKLQIIPVVVFTTSSSDEDIIKTYALHANAYITKPVDLDAFSEIILSLDQFWFGIVKLPPK